MSTWDSVFSLPEQSLVPSQIECRGLYEFLFYITNQLTECFQFTPSLQSSISSYLSEGVRKLTLNNIIPMETSAQIAPSFTQGADTFPTAWEIHVTWPGWYYNKAGYAEEYLPRSHEKLWHSLGVGDETAIEELARALYRGSDFNGCLFLAGQLSRGKTQQDLLIYGHDERARLLLRTSGSVSIGRMRGFRYSG